MAQSRLEKVGTIFSRVSNLIRTGAMIMTDRPLWYDVYRAFPPAVPPKFDRPLPVIHIKNILYQEDVIRAKCHKDLGRSLPAINLKDTQYLTVSQRMIVLCKKLQKEKNLDLESAYREAFHLIELEGIIKPHKKREDENVSIASTFKEALQNKPQPEPPININLKEVMKE